VSGSVGSGVPGLARARSIDAASMSQEDTLTQPPDEVIISSQTPEARRGSEPPLSLAAIKLAVSIVLDVMMMN